MGAFDSDRQLGFDTSIFTAMPPPVLYVTLGERMRSVSIFTAMPPPVVYVTLGEDFI